MEEPVGQRRLGLGAVAQLLGVPRLTVWWWVKSGQLHPTGTQQGQPYWHTDDVYEWALSRPGGGLLGRVPLTAWPASPFPATYLGVQELTGALAQRWASITGVVAVVWPLPDTRRATLAQWAGELAEPGHYAVLEVRHGYGARGPDLKGVLSGVPERTYEGRWADLVRAIGGPAPFWPSQLRDRQVMASWTAQADTAVVMATPALDTATLLQTAATFDDGHPTARVLVNLARLAHHQAAISAADEVKHAEGWRRENPDMVTIAARPLPAPQASLDDVNSTERRAGWLELLNRRDVPAARCVSEVSKWDGGADLPFGTVETVEPYRSTWSREWSQRLRPVPRMAAHELLTSDAEVVTLIDPATDAPVVRETDGSLLVAPPQRLSARAPLQQLILDELIWVRTADGVLYPAPHDSYFGISWGYQGSGPGTLALLIDALLDDITAKAPHGVDGAPPGLEKLTCRKLPKGTVLTRQQLEAARRGDPLLHLVEQSEAHDDGLADDDDPEDDE